MYVCLLSKTKNNLMSDTMFFVSVSRKIVKRVNQYYGMGTDPSELSMGLGTGSGAWNTPSACLVLIL